MMSNNKSEKINNGDRKKKAKLKLEEYLEFKGTLNGSITTSVDLAKTINNLFKSVFGDYEGCVIIPNHMGQVNITLYFKEKGAGNILPLAVQTRSNSMNPADRIKNMRLRNRNKTYRLSDELMEVLEQFIDTPKRGNVDWNRRVHEINENVYGGFNNIYVQVDDISIRKILKVLYGSEDKQGNKLDYNVSIVKPIGASTGSISQNYIIKVDQLNINEVEKLASKIGLMPSVGTIPMVRGI